MRLFLFTRLMLFVKTKMFNLYLNPLNQFEIRELISINLPLLGDSNIAITNISLYVFISFVLITKLNFMTNKKVTLVQTN
jgi:NADPH-dependent 7-cyano-7-deazaguanine reductase QueF-like protein